MIFGQIIGVLTQMGASKYGTRFFPQNPSATAVFHILRQAGLPAAPSYAVVGNMEAESNFNPRAVGDHGQARGLCQWHPDRRANIRRHTGIDVATAPLDRQVQAFIWEAKETDVWNELMHSGSIGGGISVLVRHFEMPANEAQQIHVRTAAAERWSRVLA